MARIAKQRFFVRFPLPGDGEWIGLMAELIVAERECCPVLAFEVAALPNLGPVIVLSHIHI